eukprot:Gb_14596 [translate_table: standard]
MHFSSLYLLKLTQTSKQDTLESSPRRPNSTNWITTTRFHETTTHRWICLLDHTRQIRHAQ